MHRKKSQGIYNIMSVIKRRRDFFVCSAVGFLWLLSCSVGQQLIKIEDPNARCLDGSPYIFYISPGDTSEFSIGIQGGGWCLTEELCKERTLTALGSSKGYNISGTWGPTKDNLNGSPVEWTCQGLQNNCTRVYLPYCDGSCFTSQNSSGDLLKMGLHFRGRSNFERTIDILENRFEFAKAKKVVLYGGSAGGLSTFLHVDYVADRLNAAASRNAPSLEYTSNAVVVGRPVAGFFISEENFNPSIPSYAEQVKYGVQMFNSTLSLNTKCLSTYPGEEWKCWMVHYMAPFVRQRMFIVQSRFDEFQLMKLLGLPCFEKQSYLPPFKRSNCTSAENSMIVAFGSRLKKLLMAYLSKKPKNGLWLVSCIQHNVVCNMHNTKEELAFQSWLDGGELGRDIGYRWVDDCGKEKNGNTPCNKGAYCAPPHF